MWRRVLAWVGRYAWGRRLIAWSTRKKRARFRLRQAAAMRTWAIPSWTPTMHFASMLTSQDFVPGWNPGRLVVDAHAGGDSSSERMECWFRCVEVGSVVRLEVARGPQVEFTFPRDIEPNDVSASATLYTTTGCALAVFDMRVPVPFQSGDTFVVQLGSADRESSMCE